MPIPPLGPRKKWPKYTDDEQALIATFLGAIRADAIDAAQKLVSIYELAPELPGTVAHITYWKNVVGGIDWMTSRLPHRQKHLQLLKLLREQQTQGV